MVVIGGGATGAILAASFSSGATRPLEAAFVKSPLGVSAGGTQGGVVVQEGTPTILRYTPGAVFALAVYVTNKAGAPVTLESVTADVLHDAPLRQIGTRLIAFTPVICPPVPAGCVQGRPVGPRPYGAASPVPLTVAPGHGFLAQLDFMFTPCSPVTGALASTSKRATVAYRIPDGTVVRQRLDLGDSTQLMRIPRADACHR